MKYKKKETYDVFVCLNCDHRQRVRFATKNPRCYICHSANMVDSKTLHISSNNENIKELKIVLDNLIQKITKLEALTKTNDKNIHTIHSNATKLKSRVGDIETNLKPHNTTMSPKQTRSPYDGGLLRGY